MDLNAESYEFLDLSDIDDSERNKLISTLYNNKNNCYNNDHDTTLPTLQHDDDQLNDNGIILKTNKIHKNNIKIKTNSTTTYGINNNNNITSNKDINYKFHLNGNKNQNSKYIKNVAPIFFNGENNNNNNNNQNISNNKNDINLLSQTQQLLSSNENSIDSSGHLIRNLMFPVQPQFLPAHLIPSIPICAIVKPTLLTEAANNTATTTNNSTNNPNTAVVPLRTPKLTASAAVKSYEDDQILEINNCGELQINSSKKDNGHIKNYNNSNNNNNQIELISENFSSTLLNKDSETDRKTKKVATMAQHAQPSLHQQQQQQSQQQQLTSQQNNNYQHLQQQQQHHQQQQHAYTQVPSGVYMPTHGGAMYSMMPAPISSVYVNNVTANVNLHGWPAHSVPSYIPGNGATYIPAGDIPQNMTHEQVIQQVQHTNSSITRTNRRGRSNGNGRGNSSNRRNDYNQRNQQEVSPVPQDLGNSIDQQPQTFHPYGGYQYAAYPQFFAAPQQALNHTQAQHATGPPLYLAASVFSPQLYNYPDGIIYNPHLIQHEYPMVDERVDDQTQQQHQHVDGTGLMTPAGTMQQHPQQMWHPHGMPIEYHEEYELVHAGSTDDINHNQSPLTASDHTPSMLSPAGHQIYYPNMQQTMDIHQQMNSLHIYDQQVVMAAAVQQQHQAMQHAEEQHHQQIQEQQQHLQVMHEQPQQVMLIIPDMPDYRQQQQIESEQEIDHMGNNINEMTQENVKHPGQIITEEQHIYMQQQQQQQQPQLMLLPNSDMPEELKSDVLAIPDYNQNVPNILPVPENIISEFDESPANIINDAIESFTFVNNTNNNNINNKDFDIDNGQIHEYETIPVSNTNELPTINSNLPINNNLENPEIENSVTLIVSPTVPITSTTTIATKTMSWTNQTKKLTASVAVTAVPAHQTNQTQKPISQTSAPVAVTNKPSTNNNNNNNNNNNVAMPPTTQIKNHTTNTKTSSVENASPMTNSHTNLERKLSAQYTEQKSIASAVVPQQLQENTGQMKKQHAIIIENQTRTTKRHTDESRQSPHINNNNHANNQNTQPSVSSLAPPPPAPQTQPSAPAASASAGPTSWAGLFASKSAANQNQYNNNNNTTVTQNNNNNNSSIQAGFINTLGSNANAVHTKPIAKVSPYEGTSNIPIPQAATGNSAGSMSYSAASARGISGNTNSNSTNQNQLAGGSKQKTITNQSSNATNLTTEDNFDEWSTKFAEFLKKYKTDFTPVSLRPRGLTNPNNYCYINAVLQALIACPPFYNLLKSLPKQSVALHNDKSKIPTINAMTQFANEFYNLPAGARLNRREKGQKINNKQDDLSGELQCDPSFEATSIYKLWNLSRSESDEGRQGDAEEFLGFVLNKLNDEMLEVVKILAKPAPIIELNGDASGEPDDGGDDWQMIYNNRNKGSVTRQADFGKTPISDIFRGELRSRLQREGEHSTDVIQPFFTLQLNIEKAASVREALEILVGRDQLEGVTCSKTNQEVVAWQQMNLEKLPYVLIFHLKWFDYKLDGCTKIVKNVEFPVELKIDTKILASKKYSQKQKLYRLFAVVYHDGKEATKGHYISDVYHTGYMSWLRCDDQNVKPISENNVLRPRGLRVPYLLYYRRCDTIAPLPSSATAQTQQSGNTIGSSNSNTHNHSNK